MGIVCLCYKPAKTPGCISQPWKINKNWWKSLTLCVWFNASCSNCFDARQKILRMPTWAPVKNTDWVVNAELSSTEFLCSGLTLQNGGERCYFSLESLPHQGCEACYIFPSIIFIFCPCVHFQSTQGQPMYCHSPRYVSSGNSCRFLNVSDLTYLVQIWKAMSNTQQFFTITVHKSLCLGRVVITKFVTCTWFHQ